jgi:hypothetical protein
MMRQKDPIKNVFISADKYDRMFTVNNWFKLVFESKIK